MKGFDRSKGRPEAVDRRVHNSNVARQRGREKGQYEEGRSPISKPSPVLLFLISSYC